MTTAPKKPRSTGPKSARGKAKSSLNALSHGLTSTRVMPDELEMVEQFTRELTEYYKPCSPLEVLQIQRIAFCRAKLAKLIDIEIAAREMARRQIELNPQMVMAKLSQYPDQIKSIALDVIGGRPALARFGLDEATLVQINEEIKGFDGVLESEEDLPRCLPKLVKFLRNTRLHSDQIADIGDDQALMVFAQKIRQQNHSQIEPGSDRQSVDALLLAVGRDAGLSEMAQRKVVRHKASAQAGYHQLVDKDLQEIRALASSIAKLPEVVRSFEEMQSWMLRSVDLNADEVERMMKYQTMLERRLSSAIGELLELQKYSLN